MKIYTKGGDKGETSLIGGARVSKADSRLNAYGTMDELMSCLGVVYDHLPERDFRREELEWILCRVMDCAAILASRDIDLAKLPRVDQGMVERLEGWTDNHMDGLEKITNFTLPIGHKLVSFSNLARTVCRRGEREIVKCVEVGNVVPFEVGMFVNRLSDYLYALGRSMGKDFGMGDIFWK